VGTGGDDARLARKPDDRHHRRFMTEQSHKALVVFRLQPILKIRQRRMGGHMEIGDNAVCDGAAFAPEAEVQSPAFDFRRVVRRTFTATGRNGVTFLALVAAAAAPERIAYHLLPIDSVGVIFLLMALTNLGCVALFAAITWATLRDFRGEPVQFGQCVTAAAQNFPLVLAIAIATATGVIAASLLLIVPGILLTVCWSVTAPVAIAEGKSLPASFARSIALTRGHRGQISVLALLLFLLAVSRGLAMLPLWGMPTEALPVFLFGNWLLPLLFTVFAAAGSASLYSELCRAKE